MSTETTHLCDRCHEEITISFGRRQAMAVAVFAVDGVWSQNDLPDCVDPIKRDMCHDCFQSIRGYIDTSPPKLARS